MVQCNIESSKAVISRIKRSEVVSGGNWVARTEDVRRCRAGGGGSISCDAVKGSNDGVECSCSPRPLQFNPSKLIAVRCNACGTSTSIQEIISDGGRSTEGNRDCAGERAKTYRAVLTCELDPKRRRWDPVGIPRRAIEQAHHRTCCPRSAG